MFDIDRHKQINKRMLEPFPPELLGEYPAVDLLRQVHRMSKITANLLDDARIYGDMPDEQEYSHYLQSVAQDAAKLMLSVAEEALRAMTDKGMKNE